MIDKATFPSINSLAEITKTVLSDGKRCGKADCIGDPDFIASPNGTCNNHRAKYDDQAGVYRSLWQRLVSCF